MSSTLDRPVPIIHSHTGIRGIAAMCVFLAHLCEFYQGWGYDLIGVQLLFRQEYALDLFFILSGFILNWVYLSNRSTFNWPSYLKARVARIMPLYYLTTGICFSIHFNNFFGNSIYQCWKNKALIILSNALLLSGVLGGWNMTLNGPAWSIRPLTSSRVGSSPARRYPVGCARPTSAAERTSRVTFVRAASSASGG